MASLAFQFSRQCSQDTIDSDDGDIEFADEEIEAEFTDQEGDVNYNDENDSETKLPDLNIYSPMTMSNAVDTISTLSAKVRKTVFVNKSGIAFKHIYDYIHSSPESDENPNKLSRNYFYFKITDNLMIYNYSLLIKRSCSRFSCSMEFNKGHDNAILDNTIERTD